MKFFDMFRFKPEAQSRPRAESPGGIQFSGLDDPALLEFIRNGGAGSVEMLRNMAAFRSLTLICNGIGMLPTNIYKFGADKEIAKDHPVHKLLRLRPNPWQTPMEFKGQMEMSVQQDGSAYARIIRAGNRPIHLIPLEFSKVDAKLGSDWRMKYTVQTETGGQIGLDQSEILHLRELSPDGVCGLSRRKLSQGVIELARSAETAARNVFKKGVMAGGAIEIDGELSDGAFTRMQGSLATDYAGAENANKWMILEEGAKANKFTSSAKDAQQIENRNHQIEEIARLYGVPRPLLMMDDTSWGSGIEQLAIYFVQFTLAPRFTAWEQALSRSLLSDSEQERFYFKFNERALMRGTLKDQAEFFAKALGAGGHQPWMGVDEVRDLSELPESGDPKHAQVAEPMSQRKATNEPQTTT
ncbi:phage portal protein [Diaphorobacter sp. HDW4B]|uniref:phage portal protein n=1 Tax=Diaphorobacter sp. HDW4B TaxID=2714925 RepID=UPI00140BFCF4|nr:phage portal protein [Diaphorobacter sp. HDW4B]QIL69572.1 phage portal protein [Diaphorobacter sp. HDW4B]QIL72314.1 phage portal protein [Diaphorobacter sp. HDW4B]